MKLEKAIEIKEEYQAFHPRVQDPDKWDADQLSIEAMKRQKLMREHSGFSWDYYLPGETKE